MTGSIIIWIAFIAALLSVFFYFISFKDKKLLLQAQISFTTSVFGIISASGLLMLYILQHRFEYNYIASYSSRDLPMALLATVFWAGQEGSLLLWAFFTAVIGIILLRYLRKTGMESEAIMVYSVVLAFLLLLISVKSPFQYVWESASDIPVGFIPQDGRGLNPLLQNFWMIIHPPVLFLGFASLTVPFVLAIAALWQKKYDEWINSALPWVLFGGASLGTGLILGGYWAYGVLGWGGWWGWDPVENSSLVPWIVVIILIHTMLIQMLTGKLIRTNLILAVLSYLLVVFSTFLTRSGVLANASVHSFMESGLLTYALLVIWLALIAICGFGMIIFHYKKLNNQTSSGALLTRESILSAAMIVLGVCAAFILFGTSSPLFSDSIIEPAFYDRTTLPLAVLMTLLLGFGLQAKWKQDDGKLLFRRLLFPGAFAALVSSGLIFFGLHDMFAALLVMTSLFSLFISVGHGFQSVKKQPLLIGSALAHAGLAILFIGIIASGRYGQKQSAALPLNQPQSIFGYKFIYNGVSVKQDGKKIFSINVNQNGKNEILKPVMFESTYNNSLMRNPDYLSFWTEDLYIEPVSLEKYDAGKQDIVDLPIGVVVTYGPLAITFKKFDLSSYDKGDKIKGTGDTMTIGVVLKVKSEKGSQTVIPVTKYTSKGVQEMKTAYLNNSNIGFQLSAIYMGTGKGEKDHVNINIVGLGENNGIGDRPETLMVEVSVKPFMNFVWIAALLMISGLAAAMVRRLKPNTF
jgi:cytochrome c-type biogenesis protein CcmF